MYGYELLKLDFLDAEDWYYIIASSYGLEYKEATVGDDGVKSDVLDNLEQAGIIRSLLYVCTFIVANSAVL